MVAFGHRVHRGYEPEGEVAPLDVIIPAMIDVEPEGVAIHLLYHALIGKHTFQHCGVLGFRSANAAADGEQQHINHDAYVFHRPQNYDFFLI